jgi:hypothetical protein
MLRVWLKSLTQNHLDVRLRVGKGLETRIVERPGIWMTEHELAALRNDLKRIATASLPGQDLTYGIFSPDGTRLDESIVTIVYRREDRLPIAFNALAIMDISLNGRPQDVVHLGLVMVDPSVRSQGLSWVLYGLTCLLLFIRNQLRPFWVSNVTQVPAIVGLVTQNFSNVYPAPEAQGRRSFAHVLLARQIMGRHRHVFGVGEDAGFDEDRFVITNAYTGGSDGLKKSFEDATKHRDAIYNEFCRQLLDYERGDDLLQLGQMDLNATRKYLTMSVPRESLRGLLLSAGLVGLQGLILPLIYWLDYRRQWGSLRPWRK